MFTCEKCRKPYAEKRSLLQHMQTHLQSTEAYSCDVCGKDVDRRYQKQTYKDPPEGSNGVWADLFMWGMRQRGQPSWHQKEAWGYPWTAPSLHLPDLQPFLPEKKTLSTAFADPLEKNGPDTTDRTKENHQEEIVTSSWTQPKAATYCITTSKDPPSCSRYGDSTWRPRDQSRVYTTLAVHPNRGSDRKPCPRQVQLYFAWDDSIHLYRDGSSDL